MNISKEQLILFSAEQDNILPLTSACNVKCIFCSHYQNPSGVEIYGISHRTMEEIDLILEFIDPNRKIVIGESVTRIMEGEPFLHPEIGAILAKIREKFPTTLIQITTNGTLLTDEILDLLTQLGRIELCISLNSVTCEGRLKLMGDSGKEVWRAIPKLHQLKIPFQGSIVAMPWIVGWGDLEETIFYLDQHHAETIRIFMPGFTKKAHKELVFNSDLPKELLKRVDLWREKCLTPLIVEPAFLNDLRAQVDGIIKNSPAESAGVRRGDEIFKIGDKNPFSRVDAFHSLIKSGQEELVVLRNNQSAFPHKICLTLDKEPGDRSGMVFAYDLHPIIYEEVFKVILQRGVKKPLLMASTLATPLIRHLVERLNNKMINEEVKVEMVEVRNRFFGGSIMAGGLLVIQDFLDQWEELTKRDYDLILIPSIFLDQWGRDLVGRKVSELEEKMNIEIEVIDLLS